MHAFGREDVESSSWMSAWAERRARLRARHPRLVRMNAAFCKRDIVVKVSRVSAVPSAAEPASTLFFRSRCPPSAKQGPKANKTHPREVRRVLSARTRRASEAKKPALDLQAPSMAQRLLQAAPSTPPPRGFRAAPASGLQLWLVILLDECCSSRRRAPNSARAAHHGGGRGTHQE